MGQVVERIQESRLVIWQGDLGEVSMGHVHRVVQIAADDCIVEVCLGQPTSPESWEAEGHDSYVANAYMLALLATRAMMTSAGTDVLAEHMEEVAAARKK